MLLSAFRLSNRSNRTPKITRILTLYQANAPTLTTCNVLKHTHKLIIFSTHNLQTFKHNKLINELLIMQLFVLNCISGSDENYACQLKRHTRVIFGMQCDCVRDYNTTSNKQTYMKTAHTCRNSILESFESELEPGENN